MSGLTKVESSLSERYTIECIDCRYLRQVFGTAEEARQSAIMMGWEFRQRIRPNFGAHDLPVVPDVIEGALCPHCKLLTKVKP